MTSPSDAIIRRSMDFKPLRHLILSLRDYLMKRLTPARILSNESLRHLMPELAGQVVELGGLRPFNYVRFATNADKYVVTNVNGDCDQYADIAQLPFRDNSVDSFMSISLLEHVPNPADGIEEVHRTLKPGGLFLALVPFMFGIHGDPRHDYYRFTESSLRRMLSGFVILRVEYLGGWLGTISLILQRKAGLIGRLFGVVFFVLDSWGKQPDDFPMMYAVLVQKPMGSITEQGPTEQ